MNLRFLFPVALLALNASLSAQYSIFYLADPTAQRVSAKPASVRVYLSGAMIEARSKATLKAGTQTIVFTDVSPFVEENSVQVKADADITILSVNYQLNYLDARKKDEENKKLGDSLSTYTKELARVLVEQRAYDEELSLLASNKSIGGANIGVSVVELQKMADFIRIRVKETGGKRLETEEKERRLNERIELLNQQLENPSDMGAPSGEIIVVMEAKTVGSATFNVSYYTVNCGWTPMYDVRVKDVNSKAQITAKANVVQNTGQEWKDVKLSLCTGNPSRGNVKPVISPWRISVTEPVVYKRERAVRDELKKQLDPVADSVSADGSLFYNLSSAGTYSFSATPPTLGSMAWSNGLSVTGSSYTSVDPQATTNAIFDISIPYTIASNGKDNIIEIQEYSVDAKYSYFSIPKLDEDAFLVADLIGWDKNELLPGEANVYFESNYVGKSYFDSRLIDDTLSFALGRDNNITIKRVQVKDLNEKSSITGNTKKITRSFEINVKNTRKATVQLEVEDQVPLSNNEELEVELADGSDAIYDVETGKLTWKLPMGPGEAKKLRFSYTVKYPKKYILNGM